MGVYMSLLAFIFLILSIQENYIEINNNEGVILEKRQLILKRISFVFVFFILGFFSAIRNGIGIDYSSYVMHIENIAAGMPTYMELGFVYLTKIFMSLTHNPRIVIGVAAFITNFFFIAVMYSQSKDIKMSIFLFLTWGYYFFTFNTIRNYLALSIILFAIKYIFDKKYTKFIILVLIAALFHKSAIICLPFYIIASKKINKQTYFLIILTSVLLFLFKEPLRDIAFSFYPHYEGSVYDSGRISYFNIIKSLLVLLYGLFFYPKIKNDIKLHTYFNLNLFSLVIYTSLYWLPEVSRIGFYFNIVSILFIPNLTYQLNKKNQKIIKISIYLFSLILFILLMISFYNPTTMLLPYSSSLF